MTSSMNEREKAFEQLFAHDEQLKFRVEARACKMFGLWIAEQLGLADSQAAAYASSVVEGNLDAPGLDDVIDMVTADLEKNNKAIDRTALTAKLAEFVATAKEQVMAEATSA